MAPLPILSARALVEALTKVGFRVLTGRGKGIHIFMHRDEPPIGVTDVRELKRGTPRAIMRHVGLTSDELNELLK